MSTFRYLIFNIAMFAGIMFAFLCGIIYHDQIVRLLGG